MTEAAFLLCGAGAVVFAALALFQRTLYGSALCLLGVLLQVAGAYFLAGARLLGLLQVLVYAGAVMVLLVIAVMSSPPRLARPFAGTPPAWLGWLALLLPFAELLAFLRLAGPADGAPWRWTPGLETQTASLLFGAYAPLTEAVGLLVLVASLSILREEP